MRIALIGYGKMGHCIEQVALSRGHEVVARIDVGSDWDLHDADVAIEFTTPATAEANIRRCWEAGVPVVCGTTGWNVQQLIIDNGQLTSADGKTFVDKNTGKTMLVWSSKFSVGVNIFFDLNKYLAQQMASNPQYTPSITETHHIHKLDKPSGTAKTLAEDIQKMSIVHTFRSFSEGDKNCQLSIESVREGEVPGTHVVTWDSPEDTIVITHIAKGREGFALGAVIAAENLVQ